MSIFKIAVSALLVLSSASASFAAATNEAPVQANSGQGYRLVPEGTRLNTGTKVLVRNTTGQPVSLKYDDGCIVTIPVGRVVTVAPQSPCALQAQQTPAGQPGAGPAAGGPSIPLILGGAILIGGGAALLLSNTDKGSASP